MHVKCYHFCNVNFYNDLLKRGIIKADNIMRYPLDIDGNKYGAHYALEYVFKFKNINNGNYMFFLWDNPSYKGEVLYNEDGRYVLLELNIPEELLSKTDYENWCSLGMDIDDVDGDYIEADKWCKELGIKDRLEGSYKAIYDISKSSEIQYMTPYLNKDWIVSAKNVESKRT